MQRMPLPTDFTKLGCAVLVYPSVLFIIKIKCHSYFGYYLLAARQYLIATSLASSNPRQVQYGPASFSRISTSGPRGSYFEILKWLTSWSDIRRKQYNRHFVVYILKWTCLVTQTSVIFAPKEQLSCMVQITAWRWNMRFTQIYMSSFRNCSSSDIDIL